LADKNVYPTGHPVHRFRSVVENAGWRSRTPPRRIGPED